MEKREDGSIISVHTCIGCARVLDAANKFSGDGDEMPTVGSVMLCFDCSYPNIVTGVSGNQLETRDPSREEWLELIRDENVLKSWELMRRAHDEGL